MKRKNKGKVVFKEYNMEQQFLLPPSLEELIDEKHLVRVVNKSIERMDLKPLIAEYKGGGTSSYHPKMLLKVLIYGYTQKIYSSRQIAKGLRENINFMWLSGQNQPDFRTINRFRSSRMKNVIEKVFQSVIKMLIEEGFIQLKNYFLDGTIIEANANRYTYVWKKSVQHYKRNIQEQIKKLWDHIEHTNQEENERYGDHDLNEVEGNEISSEKMDRWIDKINQRLSENPHPEIKKVVRKLEKEVVPRLKKYEQQEAALDGKNSYSKTDVDATFMRMKDDHLGTGQLKPAYNVQVGTENQFIVGYSVHQKSGDTSHLVKHIQKIENYLPVLPENLITDSGYGSEENYQFIQTKSLGNFVKYGFFRREHQSLKRDRFRSERFHYDPESDRYFCPENQPLIFQYKKTSKSDLGFISSSRVYQAQNCLTCPFKSDCTKSETNRTIQINSKLNHFKQTAKKNLLSPLGKTLSVLRSIEVESVFGQIKHNMNFRKFHLRGLEKVSLEWGLVAITHNLKKIPT